MVYTITFNPSVDYVMNLDKALDFGKTNRSVSEYVAMGGKGINVSLVLSELNIKSTALSFVAGFTGDEIEKRLNKKGICTDFIKLNEGMSRINVKLKGETETEINAAGPNIPERAIQTLLTKLNALSDNDVLILAGSVPKSVSKDVYAKILKSLSAKNIPCVVDATGELLLNTLSFNPFLIKPNKEELCALFNTEIKSDEEIIFYANALRERGAQNVLVSLGGDGALLVTNDNKIITGSSLGETPVNTVGAGDSMIAGFLYGYLTYNDYNEAMLYGLSCGAATAVSKSLATKDLILNKYREYKDASVLETTNI